MLADLRPPLLNEQGLAAALDNEIQQRVPSAGPRMSCSRPTTL